jgi:hypothetical protein
MHPSCEHTAPSVQSLSQPHSSCVLEQTPFIHSPFQQSYEIVQQALIPPAQRAASMSQTPQGPQSEFVLHWGLFFTGPHVWPGGRGVGE